MTRPAAGFELTFSERRRVLALAREIAENGHTLQVDWTRRLQASGAIIPPRSGRDPVASSYLAPGGGFRVPADDPGLLGEAGRAFFADRVTRAEWTYLRGYGYYAADAAMHLPDRVPSAAHRWRLVEDRWPRYTAHARALAEQAAVTPVPWCHWLAWLAFLESVANDLCSALWSAGHQNHIPVARQVEAALSEVSRLLAEAGWHLWNEPSRARPTTWAERTIAVVADGELAAALRSLGEGFDRAQAPPWAVRTIREGDTLWQVAAAFELRWAAIRSVHPDQPILLVSEAFGAIGVGPLWAALMPEKHREAVTLATNRTSVHEEEMGRVPAGQWSTRELDAQGSVVVHLDDSLFTGRTHLALRQALAGSPHAVYLVALSFDVGTPFNHPDEITTLGRSVEEHLTHMEQLVRTPGGRLPAAASMWARRKRHTTEDGTMDGSFAVVLGGSDRLLATLWERYAPEVRSA